ncbi:unnamed protein product [Trichobilharzia szidati]|nr:unnamed protein product [Trichobilharzia szidati]
MSSPWQVLCFLTRQPVYPLSKLLNIIAGQHSVCIENSSKFNLCLMLITRINLLYIFGGAIPYIPQLIEIRKSQSVKGFSTHVCLVLLLSNILRICFWFVQPFSSSLLSQSFVMIITMLVLMKTITKISRMKRSASIPSTISTKKSETEDHSINRFKKILFENFWRWTHFRHYLLFLWLFTLTSGLCTYIFSFSQVYIQLLGFSALFIEAMLGAPQFLENYKNKSVVGMRSQLEHKASTAQFHFIPFSEVTIGGQILLNSHTHEDYNEHSSVKNRNLE